MKRMLSSFLVFLLFAGLLTLSGCKPKEEPKTEPEDIVVLFTNDVHCHVDDHVGYAGLAAYKKYIESSHRHVFLVDCGDHMQGDYLGAVSKGASIVAMMNEVGYDYCTLGNHEFDFGLEQLALNLQAAKATYLCCNFAYTGTNEALKKIQPYEIAEIGGVKVAFVGVTTPMVVDSTAVSKVSENGVQVAEFGKSKGADAFYASVQNVIDNARKDGADYVIVLSHMGDADGWEEFTSKGLIQHTEGIDVLLDGHSHTEVECRILMNKKGEEVLTSQTGTGLENIGQLIISANGTLSLGYISDYGKKDPAMESFVSEVKETYQKELETVVTTLPFDLSIADTDGIRRIRNREMPLGNLVADAYREISGADIGLCNGGGIRADLKAGEVTYQNIISVNPFGNSLCVVEVTGQEIADMLEVFCQTVEEDAQKDGKAVGESGSFQQVSGLTFTVDTSVPTSVVLDENGNLLSVGDTRRVSDIRVLDGDQYVPIDGSKTYTLASHNYTIKEGGCGMGILLADHTLLMDEGESDYQVLIDFFAKLNGDFSAYEKEEGRILIR